MIESNTLPENFEILTLKIVSDKMVILFMNLHKHPSLNEKNFLCSTYENITLIGDFNMKPEYKKLNDFCKMN